MKWIVPSSALSSYASPAWITLAGPDAQDFLHRLTTADARNLEVGKGMAGCFLNAQGRIRAIFTLWRYGQEDFAFELDGGVDGRWKRELLGAIDQYTFAEKMALTDVSALECRWIFADSESEASLLTQIGAPGLRAFETVATDDEIRLCHQGNLQYGRPSITAWGRPGRLEAWLERALPDASHADAKLLERWRIEAVRPRLDSEITDATIPLEAGLIDAVSTQKGCYPGQEVIERIVSLGAPARRLALIEGEAASVEAIPAPGASIENAAEPPAEVGQLTSISTEGSRFLALAYLRKIHAKEGLEVRFAGGKATGKVLRVAPYAGT